MQKKDYYKKRKEEGKIQQKQWNMFVTKTIRLSKIENLFPECFEHHTDGQYSWKVKK